MSNKKQPQPDRQPARNPGNADVLTPEAIRNLAGYFDVLIQMDLALKQRNERNKDNGRQATDA